MSCKFNVINGELNNYKLIENDYIGILETTIRNKESASSELKKSLYKLGNIAAQEMIVDIMKKEHSVITPLDEEFVGTSIDFKNEIVVISTRDDFEYFANGIAETFGDCIRGYMDFKGVRGVQALNTPIRSMELPNITTGRPVDTVVIAKSVLATGCTALTLAKKAFEKYMPLKLIILSAFCSERGICELKQELPRAEVYVCAKPERLGKDGMLHPGVGNIDYRLSM